jgi:hypothetical protein
MDFSMDLKKCLTPDGDIWVTSGYSVCAPKMGTAVRARACFSPPFAAPDTALAVDFTANGHLVPDTGTTAKDDCGLLYSGGEWQLGKIIRRGTYHYNVNGKLISFGVISELVPLFKEAGYALKISVANRAGDALDINLTPILSAGHPRAVPLRDWEFTPPKAAGVEAVQNMQKNENIWENEQVRVTLSCENTPKTLKQGETGEFYFAVMFTKAGTSADAGKISEKMEKTANRWKNLIKLAGDKIPEVTSDIPGLEAYYNRSLISGLVCLWENDEFITNPFPATSGIDGGSICCYPWDVAGYSAPSLVMLLGETALDFLQAMLNSGIDKHISMAPDGGGLGWCPYSYSMWSIVTLYLNILAYCGKGYELFDDMVRIFLKEEERLPEWEHLKDYGRQHNLLEMRSCGYEYFVVSPNAERAWCYDRLSEIGQSLGRGNENWEKWHKKAELIRASIRENLWDGELGWFKCVHPDNHTEIIYSIQMFDTLRSGVCDENMKNALLRHIRDGAFLGKYGVTSVSAEDEIHYELNDPDWSGGGCYGGDGPELAEMLWNTGDYKLAFDVLSRHFWLGEQFLYIPQEHYCDIPGVPENKRANIIAGVTGLQAVLFGMAGIKPRPDGKVTVFPHPPETGYVDIKGYKFRDLTVDIIMKPNYVKIVSNNETVYEGEPKEVRL